MAAYNAYSCDDARPGGRRQPQDRQDRPRRQARLAAGHLRRPGHQVPAVRRRWSRAPTSTTPRPASRRTTSTGSSTLDFNGDGTDEFAKISRALYGTQKQFAIVLDGNVISAPTMNGIILNGQAQISGNFNQASAESLATSLRYGSLPIAFEKDPTVETIGPSLAGDQLSAGIFAGLIGLLAVMLYCLLYYRGLGIVVVASLLVAAAITYAMVLLLAQGCRLHPDLARHRRTDRRRSVSRPTPSSSTSNASGTRCATASPCGSRSRPAGSAPGTPVWPPTPSRCWPPWCSTSSRPAWCAGFAFALGISTVIDLVVFFWFTHPMVSWLARFRVLQPAVTSCPASTPRRSASTGSTSAPTPPADRGREGLMGKFSRLGNDLYTGKKSIDFVGRKWLWYSVLRPDRAARRGRACTSRASTWASSSRAARSTASPCPADQVTQDNADELREAVAAHRHRRRELAGGHHLR